MQHSQPTQDEIRRVVQNLRVKKQVHEASGPHVVADCVRPDCGKQGHLYLNEDTGEWDCKRCGAAGQLWSLATDLGIRLRDGRAKASPVQRATSIFAGSLGLKRTRSITTLERVERACMQLWETEKGGEVLAYLKGRGFDDITIRHFRLGLAYTESKELSVGIPYVEDKAVPLVKFRVLNPADKGKRFRRTTGGDSRLFNADGVNGCRQVVLVEGELDACSLWQMGVPHVASTSLGASANVPEQWMEVLEEAEDIVIWYDDDEAGMQGVIKLLERFGVHRCRIARIPEELARSVMEMRAMDGEPGPRPKDANDLLRAGVGDDVVRSIIQNATAINNDTVVLPGAFAETIRKAIMKGEESLGVPFPYPAVQELLRGIRGGEVTAFTGHSSAGKTTFLGAMLEKVAETTRTPCLLWSGENGNESSAGLVFKLFQRKLGRPISSLRTDADKEFALKMIERLDEDPVYFLNLPQGSRHMEELAEHVRFAVRRYGVKVVMLDHVGFMKKEDQREHISEFTTRVIKFWKEVAGELDIHIFLIAHVNAGVPETEVPTGANLKGGTGLKQEADNGMTIWRTKELLGAYRKKLVLRTTNGMRLEVEMAQHNALIVVWKKRHDEAREGIVLLDFSPKSLCFTQAAMPGSGEAEAPESSGAAANTQQAEDDPWLGLSGNNG